MGRHYLRIPLAKDLRATMRNVGTRSLALSNNTVSPPARHLASGPTERFLLARLGSLAAAFADVFGELRGVHTWPGPHHSAPMTAATVVSTAGDATLTVSDPAASCYAAAWSTARSR